MRSFTVRILANNAAGKWASWNEKIAAIKAFYASVCELDITLTSTQLTPQFAPYSGTSGNGTIYQVDDDWYAANVVPLAPGADLIIFVVPPTDHTVPCLLGFCYTQPGRAPWLTVFANETDHTFVETADQGETAVVYLEHEISHAFYALLVKTDNTHLYFYAGNPTGVLADFDFDEQQLAWYQQLVQDLEQELGMLKARQVPPIGDQPTQNGTQMPPTTTTEPNPAPASFPAKITQWAAIISKEEGANPANHNPGNLGYSTLTASWGAVKGPAKSDGGNLAVFQNDDAGLTALCNFLVLGCEDQLLDFHNTRTLQEFTAVYAGNPPQGYIDAIVQAMGGDPNVQISTFLS